jgi:predicted MFS family arabinose efflux permease
VGCAAHHQLPGPRAAAARRVRASRAAVPAPAAAAARDPRPEPGRAYVALGLAGIAIFAVFLFLTYYLQTVKGQSPLTTGLLFLPFVGCILVSSTVSNIVALPRVGPRVLIASGMLLSTAAMAHLAQLTVTSSFAAGVLPATLLMGLGFGMIFAPATNTATAGVRREDSGVASALVNTMQQVGGSIRLSALSTVALTTATTYLAAPTPARWPRRSRPLAATPRPSPWPPRCSAWE